MTFLDGMLILCVVAGFLIGGICEYRAAMAYIRMRRNP